MTKMSNALNPPPHQTRLPDFIRLDSRPSAHQAFRRQMPAVLHSALLLDGFRCTDFQIMKVTAVRGLAITFDLTGAAALYVS